MKRFHPLVAVSMVPALFFLTIVFLNCNKNPSAHDDSTTSENRPAITDISSDTAFGINDSIRISVSAFDTNGEVTTYYWNSVLLQVTDSAADSVLRAVYTTAGLDTIRIWVKDNDSYLSDTFELHVAVHEWPPYFTSRQSDSITREGDTLCIRVAAADTNSNGSPLHYVWAINTDLFKDTTDSGVFRIVGPTTDTCTVLVKAIDAQGQESSVDTFRIFICSNDAHLAGLAVIGNTSGDLSYFPDFDSDTFIYCDTVIFEDDTLRFVPRAADPKASVMVNNRLLANDTISAGIAVRPGFDTVAIAVIPECAVDTIVYRFITLRLPPSNAKLQNLTVSAGTLTPAFVSGTLEYTDTIDYDVDTVVVTPVVEEPSAVVTVNGDTVASGTGVKVNNLTVGLNTIAVRVVAGDGTTAFTYAIMLYRKPNGNTELSLLEVSAGTLAPSFTPSELLYCDTVADTIDSISVKVKAENGDCRLYLNGVTLQPDAMSPKVHLPVAAPCTLNVKVTLPDSTHENLYRVVVFRLPSSNAKLENLTISAGTLAPSFASGTLEYADTIDYALDTVTVTPVAEEPSAVVTVNGDTVASGTGVKINNLAVGPNTVAVRVVAGDGTTAFTYAIMLYRKPNENTELSLLEVSAGILTPAFSPAEYAYGDTVGNTIDSISLKAQAGNGDCRLSLNGEALQPGVMSAKVHLPVAAPCTLNVKVTLPDGTHENVYRIVVFRLPSSNANLQNLAVSAGTLAPSFVSATLEYADTIDYALDTVTVTPVVEEPSAVVTVNGTAVAGGIGVKINNLAVGPNTVAVRVVAGDGTTAFTYTIMLYRKPNENTELSLLEVSAGILTPAFSPADYVYRDTVDNAVDSISIKARAENGDCKLYLNGVALQPDVMSAKIHLPVAAPCTLNVRVTLPDGTHEKPYMIVVYRLKSSESTLARLSGTSLDPLDLRPAFAGTVYNYYDSVPYARTTATVIAEPKHPGATVTVNGDTVNDDFTAGPVSLATGNNQITINVYAENGIAASTYTLNLYRAFNDDPILSGLTVSTGTLVPAFRDSVYLYTVAFAYGTTSFTVTPTARGSAAEITVSGPSLPATAVASGTGSPAMTLTAGQWDTAKVVVTAEDDVTQLTYRIAVTVSAPPIPVVLPSTISSSMTLSDIDTYYTASSCITIPAGVTLTVNEGVTFRFKGDTGAVISVLGTLIINGTEDHPVEFNLLDDPSNKDTTRWGYISSTSGTLDLNYVRVTKAHRFISANYGNVRLNHCYADKTYWTGTLDCVGIHYAANVLIEYCEFHGNPDKGADCLDLDSADVGIVRYNSIYDFADDGIDIGTGSPSFQIEHNFVKNCSFGITVGENSTVTFDRNIVVACRDGAMQSHTGAMINAANNTFYKNLIGILCYRGSSAGSMNIKNTIFANTAGTLINTVAASVLTISYSLSNTEALPGTTNLLDDPELSDPDNGDFKLSGTSPCRNNGNPDDPVDACGAPKIDIGAVESGCD